MRRRPIEARFENIFGGVSMAIESVELVSRVARNACRIATAGLLSAVAAMGQAPVTTVPVTVTSGSVVPFNHGSTGPWGQIYALKVAHDGSVVFLDSPESNIYQLAPGSTTPTLVVGPAPNGQNSNGSTLEAANSYWNGGIAIDPNNALYVTDRYGASVKMQCVPFSTSAGTWVFNASSNWASFNSVNVNPQDIFIADDGTFYISQSETGEIDKFTVSGPCGTVQNFTPVITGLETIASNVAVDHAGNLYFLENVYTAPSKRITGIRIISAAQIAAGTLTGDSKGGVESALPRVDPVSAGFNFKGMTFDAHGNMYLSSENDGGQYGGNANLVLLIPNLGTPTSPNLSWADAEQVAPVGSGFPIAVDPRGFLWIPTGGGGSNWAPQGTTAPACNTNPFDASTCLSSAIVEWGMGTANLPASPVGTAGTAGAVYYNFSAATTPSAVAIAKPGASNFILLSANPNADPAQIPPIAPCAAGTTYPAFSGTETSTSEYSWCAVYPELNTTSAGSVSGDLQLLDSNKNVIPGSNAYVSGVGQGPVISVLSPALATPIASGLQGPKQVAADAWGDSFVADPTLGKVEEYPAGQTTAVAGTSVGTFSAPTGVATDPAGDVFVGDSGKVYMVPFVNGALASAQQAVLTTGLGSHLSLAADGIGNIYVADADNKQVLKIPNTGASLLLGSSAIYQYGSTITFSGPSAIATDDFDDVFVADGSNLWEFSSWGGATEITSALSTPVTGLAVDPSGSIFVAETGGVAWLPYDSTTGGFNINGAVTIATTLGSGSAAPIGVALDGFENAYISYGSGATAGLAQVGVGGSISWGTIVPYIENDEEAQVYNLGNAPLTLTAFASDTFTGANALDYAVGTPSDSPACDPSTPLGSGSGCFLDVALTPSTLGASSATLGLQSNAANAPTVNIALAASVVVDNRNPTTTSVSVAPTSGITYPGSATVTVGVAANTASNGVPTGQVTVVVTGEAAQSAQLQNGQATFTYSKMLGGTKTVRAEYSGDGTAGTPPDFAGSAAKTTFAVNAATPAGVITMPSAGEYVSPWAGNVYISLGQPSTITATVTSTVGTPTGTVTFAVNGQPVDPTQTAIPLDANGNAAFSTTNLPLGVYNITAVYSGDQNFAAASIPVPTFEIINQSIQITSTPATLTTTAGTPVTATLNLQPLVGFNQVVGIQCVTASLPPYSECTFAYPVSGTPNILVGSNGFVGSPIVVTISTNVPVNGPTSGSSAVAKNASKNASTPMRLTMAGIFGLGLIGLIAGRKRFHRHLNMLCMAILLAGALGGISACTNIGYSNPPPPINVVTPAGTYNVQIITVNPKDGTQNSLTAPVFTLPVTISSSSATSTAANASRPATAKK
jgi:hypothetical protein